MQQPAAFAFSLYHFATILQTLPQIATFLHKLHSLRYLQGMSHLQDFETGASHLEEFLYTNAGTAMDTGADAQASVQQQLWANQPHGTSLDFVEQEGANLGNGFVEVYDSRSSTQRLQDIGRVLAGAYVVTTLTPDIALPSVVAVTQPNPAQLQLWMSRQPWRASGMTDDQSQLLAAAAQLEAPGVGQHKATQQQTTGEAQHLLSMLSIAEQPHLLQDWSKGAHLNHSPQFRAKGTLPAVSGTLLEQQHQISSVRLRQNQQRTTEISIDGNPFQAAPHARLLWHRDSMQASNEQGIRVCDSTEALTIVQGAGFMAVRHAINNVQRVISGDRA